MFGKKKQVVETYKGNQAAAQNQFLKDSKKKLKKGYFPASQTWEQGSWGGGDFVVALLLCLVLIGILVFIYMLLVKPSGTLTVTYNLEEDTPGRQEEKTCPDCAEQVKAAAKICRYCSHEFDQSI
jgi:hypothetical protein